jgi:pyrroloquinoline quinone biosynthesis protein D
MSERPGVDHAAAEPRTCRLALARRVRMKHDEVRGVDVLLLPESVLELNAQGAEIVRLCDGTRTVEEMVAEMGKRYSADVERDVRGFVERLEERGCVVRV